MMNNDEYSIIHRSEDKWLIVVVAILASIIVIAQVAIYAASNRSIRVIEQQIQYSTERLAPEPIYEQPKVPKRVSK
jgi:hypothetical protein